MKSTLLRLLATVGVGVAGLTTGLAASAPLPGTPDESGIKACADYSTSPHSDGVYDPTTGALNFRVILADNMCKNITYTFVVVSGTALPPAGQQVFTWTDVRQGDSSTNIYTITTTFANPPANVCVYATTTTHNGTLLDRAPADPTSCYLVPTPGGGTGGTGMW